MKKKSEKIDLIIPVYGGVDTTKRCIKSVLDTVKENESAFDIVVIDDASPYEEIRHYLKALEEKDVITLIINQSNLGFVQSVNKGMALHDDRDVILLNSDTEVFGNWVDRLKNVAYSQEDIATVTPVSNNAALYSYPAFFTGGDLPKNWSAKEMDTLFNRLFPQRVVEIPTGVGFCLFITRKALKQVGFFDHKTFGKGYGEECDFCMKARNKFGFRHVLCIDTYIFHKGTESFGSHALKLKEEAEQKMAELWPEYHQLLIDFIKENPLLPFRKIADNERIRLKPKDGPEIANYYLNTLQSLYSDSYPCEHHLSMLKPVVIKLRQELENYSKELVKAQRLLVERLEDRVELVEQIRDLEKLLGQRDQTIKDLQEQNSQLLLEIEANKKTIKNLNDELELLHQKLNEILNSNTWKMTAWLRAAKSKLNSIGRSN